MLTSKQRAQLRGLAATEDTIVHIGKGGITDNIVTQMNDALKARRARQGARARKFAPDRARGVRPARRDLPRGTCAGHRLKFVLYSATSKSRRSSS